MKISDKYLGINEPVTFKVMDELFYRFFTDEEITDEIITKLLQERTSGGNRFKKALSQVKMILNKNEKLLIKIKHSNCINYPKLSEIERKSLILSCVFLTYPVMYRILNIFGRGFLINNSLNKKYVEEKLAAFYGSNRGIFNALNSVISTFIDFKILNLQKRGVYNKNEKWIVQNPIINELLLYCETYYSLSQTILQNEIEYKPIFNFFEYPSINRENLFLLDQIVLRESEKYYRVKG
jgi:hypothetical protein